MTKLKITGDINKGYKIEVGGKDISEFTSEIHLAICTNETPRLDVMLLFTDVEIDIDNIEYFIEQHDKFHMKLNALDRGVTK